jgi:micrococcal nuclease
MKKLLLLPVLLLILTSANVCDRYEAFVLNVYDGDTITTDTDLGFNVHQMQKIRIYGIDAPEVRGEEREEGLKSRDALRALILNKEVELESHGFGKYGRVIAEVYVDDTINVSDWLVRNGYAEYKEY